MSTASNGLLVKSRILSKESQLTNKELEISNFVLENYTFISEHTISELALEIGTSDASINRFCKKIGYKGFNDFKKDIIKDNFFIAMKEQYSTDNNVQSGKIKKVATNYNNMLVNIAANISTKEVDKTIKEIADCETLYIFGNYYSSPAVNNFSLNFTSLGIKNIASINSEEIKIHEQNISSKDFIIIIAPSVFSDSLFNIIKSLYERKNKICIITNYYSSHIENYIFSKFILTDSPFLNNNLSTSLNSSYIFLGDIFIEKLFNLDNKYQIRKVHFNGSLEGNTNPFSNYIDFSL